MRWMELIKLQTVDISEAALEEVGKLMREITATSGIVTAEVYMHASVAGDMALLLIWETVRPSYHGSFAGLQLVGELRKFGLVAHAVWIGMP